MDGKATAVSLLGLGLLGLHITTSDDGQVVRNAISEANNGPPPKTAHPAFVRTGGLLLGVIIATIMATASDSAANIFIAFFLMLLVIWGFQHSDEVPKLGGKGKSYTAVSDAVGRSHTIMSR